MRERLVHRREVLRLGAIGAGATLLGATMAPATLRAQAPQGKPAPLDRDLVQEFVRAAHGNLEKTRSLLAAEPGLINATWDWGGGDFETGLGGASHMGRADIAQFLLASGARMDLFCATMLGKLEVVRACVADDPAIVHVKGPHGIPLLKHARAGKQDAVVSFLTSSGATD